MITLTCKTMKQTAAFYIQLHFGVQNDTG